MAERRGFAFRSALRAACRPGSPVRFFCMNEDCERLRLSNPLMEATLSRRCDHILAIYFVNGGEERIRLPVRPKGGLQAGLAGQIFLYERGLRAAPPFESSHGGDALASL